MPRRLRAWLLSLVIAASVPGLTVGGLVLGGEALAQSRSSGGYSRPSMGRTPSYRGPSVRPRTPSTSGGYGRPSVPSGGYARRPSTAGSAWDRGYSQRRSAEALDRLRQRQAPPAPIPAPAPAPAPAPGQADPGWWRRGGTLDGPSGGYPGGYAGSSPRAGRGGWYGDRGWQPGAMPGFGQRSFGLWDGVFLWFLLNNLNRAGAADFFHNHRDDPGTRDFRAEVERRAQDDPELRRRLDELDSQLAQREGQPRDPAYLPPDVPPQVALAPEAKVRTPGTGAAPAEAGGFGLGWLWLPVLAGGGILLLRMRRRQPAQAGGTTPMPRNDPTKSTADFSAAPRFRIGMTVTCDPTPFLLAGAALKVPPPAAGRTSIEAVGRIREGSEELTRLYLPGGQAFFQVYVNAEGSIQDCRYFAEIDQVVPADEAEWGVWLDPAEGLIGWPEFQAKDGRLYARHWAPGDGPVPPRAMPEVIEELQGTHRREAQAMLYAAPTGALPPAPQVEYLLVAANEEAGRAWVSIHAGIDINPTSLSLG